MAESYKAQTTTESGPDSKHRSSPTPAPTPEVFPSFEGLSGFPDMEDQAPESTQAVATGETATRNGRAHRSSGHAGQGNGRSSQERPQVDPIVEWLWSLGRGFRPEIFQRHVDFLSDGHLSGLANREQRATVVRELRRTYGNRYVQRVVEQISRLRAESVQPKRTASRPGDMRQQEPKQAAPSATERGLIEDDEGIPADDFEKVGRVINREDTSAASNQGPGKTSENDITWEAALNTLKAITDIISVPKGWGMLSGLRREVLARSDTLLFIQTLCPLVQTQSGQV